MPRSWQLRVLTASKRWLRRLEMRQAMAGHRTPTQLPTHRHWTWMCTSYQLFCCSLYHEWASNDSRVLAS